MSITLATARAPEGALSRPWRRRRHSLLFRHFELQHGVARAEVVVARPPARVERP
jgi:hypothetical protein